MLAGSIVVVIFYRLFTFVTFLVLSGLVLGGCAVFAFIKINGRPFHLFVLNIIQTFKRHKVRIWNQQPLKITEVSIEPQTIAKTAPVEVKHYTRSRLNELSLVVDTRGFYRGEEKGSEEKLI
jgi:hypothetical protein